MCKICEAGTTLSSLGPVLTADISTAVSQVVMEYDGVVVEDTSHLQRMAWQKVAEEEGRSIPPLFLLQRAEGMKNDQVMPSLVVITRRTM